MACARPGHGIVEHGLRFRQQQIFTVGGERADDHVVDGAGCAFERDRRRIAADAAPDEESGEQIARTLRRPGQAGGFAKPVSRRLESRLPRPSVVL